MASDNTSVAAPVELANAMQAGFQDAMTRIKTVALDPKSTLVDTIPADQWAAWDETDESPNIMDSAIDGFEDDGVAEPAAA